MVLTMWTLVEFVFAGISTVLVYLFVRTFLQREPFQFRLLNVSILMAAFALNFLTNMFFNENVFIISGVTMIVAFAIGRFCFSGKLTGTFLSAFFVFISGLIAELLAGIVIVVFQEVPLGEFMEFGAYRLLGRIISFLFFLIIVIVVNRFRKSKLAKMSTGMIFALCILPIASILIAQHFVSYMVDIAYAPSVREVVPMLSIIVVNIFIFILVENIMRQNEKNQDYILVTAQSDAQQKHISQLIENYEQVKRLSHDFKHQVDVLYKLCDDEKYNELKETLYTLSNSHGGTFVIKTGNSMLDAILSLKKEEATKQGIDFEMNLNVSPDLPYMSMEICVLLGNAMDNAIEACARSQLINKTIEMEFTADASKFLFYMINDIGEVPQAEGDFLKTKKSDSVRHGVGLKSIKQISNKLGGDMTYEYNNRQFAIWIHLPIM